MNKIYFFLLVYFFSSSAFSQYKEDYYPFIRGGTPPYLSIYGGVHGHHLSAYEFGFGYNMVYAAGGTLTVGDTIIPNRERPLFSAFVGPQLFYAYDKSKNLQTVSFVLAMKTVIGIGFDFNLNFKNDQTRFGFRPYIAMYLLHFNFEYGYNFFKKDNVLGLNHDVWRIGLNLPIYELYKKRN